VTRQIVVTGTDTGIGKTVFLRSKVPIMATRSAACRSASARFSTVSVTRGSPCSALTCAECFGLADRAD